GDGVRHLHVTGVQTWALPVYTRLVVSTRERKSRRRIFPFGRRTFVFPLTGVPTVLIALAVRVLALDFLKPLASRRLGPLPLTHQIGRASCRAGRQSPRRARRW